MLKRPPRPRPLREWGGQRCPGGRFSGPRPPHNELYSYKHSSYHKTTIVLHQYRRTIHNTFTVSYDSLQPNLKQCEYNQIHLKYNQPEAQLGIRNPNKTRLVSIVTSCITLPLSNHKACIQKPTNPKGKSISNPTTSAKSHPPSEIAVLPPETRSLDPASSTSSASCTLAPYLVASAASGDPSQYCVPSGHMQPTTLPLTHPDSKLNTIIPQNLPVHLGLRAAFSEAQPGRGISWQRQSG